MKQFLALTTLLVHDYDEAIDFYVNKLGFQLVEDSRLSQEEKRSPQEEKRWVVVAPPGAVESRLLLARAVGPEQTRHVGNQTGGRVFLFLHTDNFYRDYQTYRDRGVVFLDKPRRESYGTVVVLVDLYGNRWDLLQPQDHDA